MTALIRAGIYMSEVQASWGFWEVRCGCCRYGAERLQRFQPHVECRVCGQATEVVWPSKDMVWGIERLLMMRPDPTTRNWRPGESLPHLMWENGAHGIFDGMPDVGPGYTLFMVSDHQVCVDWLPELEQQMRKSIR